MSEEKAFANPFSFGVIGLAVACFALAPILMGWVKSGSTGFIAWAFMFGGMAQLLAGLMDFRIKNMLGGTALSTYGCLWIGLAAENLMNNHGLGASKIIGGNVDIMLFLMSVGYTYAFAATNLATFLILLEIDFAFLGLAILKLGVITDPWLGPALGILVYIIGLNSIYAATAVLLNTFYNKEVLPLGAPLIKKA